jgi:hypothetical protein
MKPEAALKMKIRADLRARGAYVFSPVQMGLGPATLDILACLPVSKQMHAIGRYHDAKGIFVGIEVKVPGNKPTARQKATIEEIKKAGGIAFWCDSLAGYQLLIAGMMQ